MGKHERAQSVIIIDIHSVIQHKMSNVEFSQSFNWLCYSVLRGFCTFHNKGNVEKAAVNIFIILMLCGVLWICLLLEGWLTSTLCI